MTAEAAAAAMTAEAASAPMTTEAAAALMAVPFLLVVPALGAQMLPDARSRAMFQFAQVKSGLASWLEPCLLACQGAHPNIVTHACLRVSA